MGRMVLVKCNCGYCDERFRFGVNWSYREVKKHQTALARSGRYGMEWKNLLASDPELLVDVELHLYQCPRCHQLFSEYRMDLYKSLHDDGFYYVPSEEEILYHYKHLCPNCKKLMTRIPLSQQHGLVGINNSEELVICPKCGDTAIAEFCGWTD